MKAIIVTCKVGRYRAESLAGSLVKYNMPHAIMQVGNKYLLVRKILTEDYSAGTGLRKIDVKDVVHTFNWREAEGK